MNVDNIHSIKCHCSTLIYESDNPNLFVFCNLRYFKSSLKMIFSYLRSYLN